MTSVLVPWSTCGAYISGVLGVSTADYFPYCFFNLLSPILDVVYGFLGFKVPSGVPRLVGARRPNGRGRVRNRLGCADDARVTAGRRERPTGRSPSFWFGGIGLRCGPAARAARRPTRRRPPSRRRTRRGQHRYVRPNALSGARRGGDRRTDQQAGDQDRRGDQPREGLEARRVAVEVGEADADRDLALRQLVGPARGGDVQRRQALGHFPDGEMACLRAAPRMASLLTASGTSSSSAAPPSCAKSDAPASGTSADVIASAWATALAASVSWGSSR